MKDAAPQPRETPMKASVGDRIIIDGHHVGEPERDGEILEVRGPDGTGPYLVQWSDTGDEGVLYPGTDARVQHFVHDDEGSAADS